MVREVSIINKNGNEVTFIDSGDKGGS